MTLTDGFPTGCGGPSARFATAPVPVPPGNMPRGVPKGRGVPPGRACGTPAPGVWHGRLEHSRGRLCHKKQGVSETRSFRTCHSLPYYSLLYAHLTYPWRPVKENPWKTIRASPSPAASWESCQNSCAAVLAFSGVHGPEEASVALMFLACNAAGGLRKDSSFLVPRPSGRPLGSYAALRFAWGAAYGVRPIGTLWIGLQQIQSRVGRPGWGLPPHSKRPCRFPMVNGK